LALDNEQLKQLIQQQQRTIAELKSFIDLDLPRTFSDLTIFKDPSSKSYDEIMSVLIALARSKPDIGYVSNPSCRSDWSNSITGARHVLSCRPTSHVLARG
jgi:hypothetical protein